jgi:hypothetical protein
MGYFLHLEAPIGCDNYQDCHRHGSYSRGYEAGEYCKSSYMPDSLYDPAAPHSPHCVASIIETENQPPRGTLNASTDTRRLTRVPKNPFAS